MEYRPRLDIGRIMKLRGSEYDDKGTVWNMESLSAGWRYNGTSGAGAEGIHYRAGHEKNTIYAVFVRVGRVLSFCVEYMN